MNKKRQLEAKFDHRNRIDLWTCSACAWTKFPDDRMWGPTASTLKAFEMHKCEDFRHRDQTPESPSKPEGQRNAFFNMSWFKSLLRPLTGIPCITLPSKKTV